MLGEKFTSLGEKVMLLSEMFICLGGIFMSRWKNSSLRVKNKLPLYNNTPLWVGANGGASHSVGARKGVSWRNVWHTIERDDVIIIDSRELNLKVTRVYVILAWNLAFCLLGRPSAALVTVCK